MKNIIIIFGFIIGYYFFNRKVNKMERIKNFIRDFSKNDEETINEMAEILSDYPENRLIYILAIITQESRMFKYAIGDNGYSVGLGQISIYKGLNGNKESTFEMLLRKNKYNLNFNHYYNLLINQNKIENNKLFDIKVQITLINQYIVLAINKINKEGYKVNLKNISYLYNAGINSDLSKVKIWMEHYNYYESIMFFYSEINKYFMKER